MPDLDLSFDSPPPAPDLAARARLQARGRRRTHLSLAVAAAVASVAVAVPLLTGGSAHGSQQQILSPPASQTAAAPSASPAPVPVPAQTSAPAQAASSNPVATPARTSTPKTPTRPPSRSPAPSLPATPTAPATTPPTTAVSVKNLPMTDRVVAALVAAKAALNGLPAADYTGLEPGQRYNAYDPTTGTDWAAAAALASDTSVPAQVTTNDNGSYDLFRKTAGGQWTAYDVGLSGIAGTTCPITPPLSITQLWGWAPGTCRPTG